MFAEIADMSEYSLQELPGLDFYGDDIDNLQV